jgi:hypothetical protein
MDLVKIFIGIKKSFSNALIIYIKFQDYSLKKRTHKQNSIKNNIPRANSLFYFLTLNQQKKH